MNSQMRGAATLNSGRVRLIAGVALVAAAAAALSFASPAHAYSTYGVEVSATVPKEPGSNHWGDSLPQYMGTLGTAVNIVMQGQGGNFVIDNPNDTTATTQVRTAQARGSNSQKFYFQLAGTAQSSRGPQPVYRIIHYASGGGGKCLDAYGATGSFGTKVYLDTCHTNANQLWTVAPASGEAYDSAYSDTLGRIPFVLRSVQSWREATNSAILSATDGSMHGANTPLKLANRYEWPVQSSDGSVAGNSVWMLNRVGTPPRNCSGFGCLVDIF